MVPPGHLAASITHSPTAEEILKHAFWGLICSHKSLIHTGHKGWYKFGFVLNYTRCLAPTLPYEVSV
ncbi:hypothetical protein NC652_030107 [Populus alba x Populus x berolinensis]|nr:hypothetical protein NC652_030107 [Populus alba x Populus x berolinensis]